MADELLVENRVSFLRPDYRSSDAAPSRLAAAVELMRSRPGETHTVLSLAKLVGMSRSTFMTSFRRYFGRSPMEFLRSTRLDQAAQLLRTSSLPIKLIGANVGYDSRTSFANAFRRAFGVSAADYRASHGEHASTDIHAVSEHLRTQRGPSQDLAWEVDLASGTVWWSDGTFAALGYKTGKRRATGVARFYERIHPDDRGRVVENASAACSSSEQLTWNAEFQFRKADGTYAAIANGSVILRDSNGAAVRLIGVMRVLDK